MVRYLMVLLKLDSLLVKDEKLSSTAVGYVRLHCRSNTIQGLLNHENGLVSGINYLSGYVGCDRV